MACRVSGGDDKGVCRRMGAFKVRAGFESDRTRCRIDSEILGVCAIIRIDQAVGDVLATIGGVIVKGLRGIDGGAGGGVLGNAHRGGSEAVAAVTRGEAGGDLIEVIDAQGDRAVAGVTRGIGSNNGEAVAGFAFKIRVTGQRDRTGGRVNSQTRVAARFEREGHPTADIAAVGGRGGVNHLTRAAVFVDRRGRRTAGDGRCHFVEVINRKGDRAVAGIACRIGGHDSEAVAGFAFKIRVAGQRDRTGGRVDGQTRVAARFEREGHPTADIAAVGGRGGVNHLTRAAVFVDRRGRRTAGDGRCHFVEVINRKGDRAVAGIACRIGGHDSEAVAGFAFKIRVAGQRDRTGGRVDGQTRVAARFEREGHPAADITAVGGRGGVNHLTRPAVFVDRCGRRAAGDRRRHFVEVINRQGDRLTAGIAGGIGGDDGETVAGFAFIIRIAGQCDRAGRGIDAEQGTVTGGAQAIAELTGVGSNGSPDHLTCPDVLIHTGRRGAAKDRRMGINNEADAAGCITGGRRSFNQ